MKTIIKKNKFYNQSDEGSFTSLNVDTSLLSDFGTFLTSSGESLDVKLDALNTQMSLLTNSWKDQNGINFAGKFSAFITEAKKVKDDISSLGTFASNESSKYDAIINSSKSIINGVPSDE